MQAFPLEHETGLPTPLQVRERPALHPWARAAGNGLHTAADADKLERERRRSIEYWYFCEAESSLSR